jgi:hypothetical protein
MDSLINLSIDPSAVLAELEARATRIGAALANRLTAINEALAAKIQGEKLSGQVLKQRSGKLIGSVRTLPTAAGGSVISGGVAAGGGPAYYGYFQNYGTKGPYTIVPKDPKGVLAFMIDGKQIFAKKVIHPGLPARNFMESTLEESRDKIVASIDQALRDA